MIPSTSLVIHILIVKFVFILESFAEHRLFPTNNKLIDRILPEDYDPLIAPKLDGNPVNVGIKISLLNIRSIKETELSYVADIFYHQYWSDYRILPQNLSVDERVVLDNKWRDKLWIPDSYFKNALSGHVTDIIFPTLYFAIHNQTEIFMATRVSLQLSCDMNFQKFPHDTQECNIDIMSLSHNTQSVILYWKEFYITNRLFLPQFYLDGYNRATCHRHYAIGNFSCLRAVIRLKRESGLYLVKKYIPSTLIVVMSFVGFWIPVTAYPARVALVITALLALITQQHQSSEVNVSYVIALNVWMIMCIAFVFFGLIEYAIAIAYFESRQQFIEDHKNRIKQIPVNGNNVEMVGEEDMPKEEAEKSGCLKWINNIFSASNSEIKFPADLVSNCTPVNTIDFVSRYLFPTTFVICIIFYIVYIYAL